jgi:hypothetical protein
LKSVRLQPVFNPSSTRLQPVFNPSSTRLQPVFNPSSTRLQPAFNPPSSCLQAAERAKKGQGLPQRRKIRKGHPGPGEIPEEAEK